MSDQVRQSFLFAAQDWRVIYQSFTNVNFNAYDFDTIRSAMVDYVRFFFPEDFNDYINSSEFIALIDLLAYLGESLAFRMDLNTRENFIDDAERRESLLRLARFLSYNPSRNNCASGLLKLLSVSSNQDIIDSLGRNLNGQTINFNDPNNPDWFEQFILILNAAFVPSNPFGKPLTTGTVNNVPTQLYQFNSVAGGGIRYPFNATVDGNNTDFEIVNTNFTDGMTFFEDTPDPNAAFHIVYQSDGNGFSSSNTGFFVLFKQGDLAFQDFQLSFPLANRILSPTATGINNTDVWVQTVLDTGAVSVDWTQVPSVFNQNIIFNNIPTTIRNIFSIITEDNDGISIRFSDGTFGTIPTGIIRVWYRTSSGTNSQIRPQDIPSVQISLVYITSGNLQKTLTMTFGLQTAVINSSPAETDDSIRLNAPQVYYTRDRMVNGEDYNIFPLSSPLILKVKAINRTYSGFNRFIDINDPTGLHQDVTVFSSDGIIYEEFDTEFTELPITSTLTPLEIILNNIQPMIETDGLKNFFYLEYQNFVKPITAPDFLVWNQAQGATNVNTGRFVLLAGSPTSVIPPALYQLNSVQLGVDNPAASAPDYMIPGSQIKFNTAGWVAIQNVTNNGNGFNSNGVGDVLLTQPVLNNDFVTQIIPAFNTTLSSTEISNITAELTIQSTFGIRYDAPSGTWIVITGNNLNQNGNFSLANAGDTSGNNRDASWLVKCVFTGLSWQITVRILNYFFESVQDVRFFFIDKYKIVDQNTGLSVFDSIDVLKINSQPTSSFPIGVDQIFSIEQNIIYPDGFVEPRRVIVQFVDNNNDGIPNNPQSFETIVGPGPSYVYWQVTTTSDGYQELVPTTSIIQWMNSLNLNGLTILQNQVVFFFDLLQFYQSNINQQFTTNIPFSSVQNNFTSVQSQYQFRTGRNNLYFRWVHFAPTDQRIDPALTNIIDMYVLTADYNSQIQTWLSTGMVASQFPAPPTSSQLDTTFASFDDFKMVSDEIVWHPVQYKLLFGLTANPELQAQFQVVLSPQSALSAGQVQSQIISLINNYFNFQFWDFGDTFFASELLAYLHQQLAPNVAGIVLVPLSPDGRFGDLYEIQSNSNELFLSTATVDNVVIVPAFTATNIRIGS